jgi:hypothetical protein
MAATRLKGTRGLDTADELVLRAKSGSIRTFDGTIIAADANSLSFEISSRDRGGCDHLRVVKLCGVWQADERNRLQFLVNDNREAGCLVFGNSWELDCDQRIVYTSTRSGGRVRNNFCLDGHWLLNSSERIRYSLGAGAGQLEFRCQLESISLQPRKGCVKFRIGSGVETRRKGPVVSIFGDWRFGRSFGIDFRAGTNGNFELDLSRSLKTAGGKAFLRLLKSGGEKKITAGITIPF